MRLETIHPKELGPVEIGRWRGHQLACASLQSPYLTPDWAQLIGAARDEARVVVVDGGAGFLGVQRLSRFSAMGLGAPIADYQGIVGEQGLKVSGSQLCRALHVGRIDLTHVPVGQALLPNAAGVEGSWIAETQSSRELYEAGLKLRRGEFVRQSDKKARKFAREHGHVEFRARSGERGDFETMIAWKNEQLKRSGQPEIWATPWVRQAVNACFEAADPQFSGMLFTLRLEDRLAAAAFCLRAGRVLHFWIVAHDSAFDTFSPGVQLSRWIVGWAGENGIAEVDFGPGDYQYKRQLSTTQRMLQHGVVTGASVSGALRRAAHVVRAQAERLGNSKLAALPGKAMRRVDLMRALSA